MLIRVRAGEMGADEPQPRGAELWSGGYGAGEDDKLPAALLAARMAGFEVGRWFPLEHFETLLTSWDQSEDAPTTVDIVQSGIDGPWSSTLQVQQGSAALMLCACVLDHVKRFKSNERIWVRVD